MKVDNDFSSFPMRFRAGFVDQETVKVEVSFPMQDITGIRKARWGGDIIEISVSGNTDGAEELVRNSNNYRARVAFKDLRYKSLSRLEADVLMIRIIKVPRR